MRLLLWAAVIALRGFAVAEAADGPFIDTLDELRFRNRKEPGAGNGCTTQAGLCSSRASRPAHRTPQSLRCSGDRLPVCAASVAGQCEPFCQAWPGRTLPEEEEGRGVAAGNWPRPGAAILVAGHPLRGQGDQVPVHTLP